MENIDVIEDYISTAKIKVVEIFDYAKKQIKYTGIKQNQKIKVIRGDEEVVRAYYLTKLVNEMGYKASDIEIEKEYNVGRKSKNKKPRIDVIVRDTDENAFLFIELKSPEDYEVKQDETVEDQLFMMAGLEVAEGFKVKYLSMSSIDVINGEIKEKSIVIDYDNYASFSDWSNDRNFSDAMPPNYGLATKEPYIKNGIKDLETDFSHQQIDDLRKNLHNVLWGGGGSDDNEIFSSLTNLILAKIQDESEKNDGEKYDFQISNFESDEEIFERINSLYQRALKSRMNIVDDIKISKSYVVDENKFSLSKLKYTIQKLEKFSLVDGKNSFDGKDILGDFFEGIIREGFKQTKGQFFTHINVVKFLLWGLQLDKLAIDTINNENHIPYLIDPSSGSGTFIIEYMKFITKNIKYRFRDKLHNTRDIQDFCDQQFLPDHRENKWSQNFIYGSELNFNLGTAAKVNMILHGDGSSNIFVKDGLIPFENYKKDRSISFLEHHQKDENYNNKQVNAQFDVIVSNPPFSVDLDDDTKKAIGDNYLFPNKKNSENLFIERYYQLLKENGRMAIVLPESVFDTTENKYIRLFVYKYFNVKAIVSLPQITFEPFTSTKTSCLFAQKKTAKQIVIWDGLWSKYSNEWGLLKTRCEKEVEHFINGKDISKKWAIFKEDEETRKSNLIRILKDLITDSDIQLSLKDLVFKYESEIIDLCKFDKDTKDVFGFINTWWVFGEVSKELNYSIFMAEADYVGYKRTKRGEKPMPNDLYRLDGGVVAVDDGVKETLLDYLRDVKWD